MGVSLYNKLEKGDAMYYEIYIDSLFLVNFVMNLYLLLLVNKGSCRTATWWRLIAGAAIGAVCFLVPFFLDGAVWFKLLVGLSLGTCLMICAVFPIHSFKGFLKILEKLIMLSFLMGGGILFILQRCTFIRQHMLSIFGVMGAGAVIFLLVNCVLGRNGRQNSLCKVTLIGTDGRMKIVALIDSGNSLVEPISGKPVSVIEKGVFYGLWKEPPELYRVIPYHSIGKTKGILKGYLLPEIQIEWDGVTKHCKDVYVAVSEESISGEKISMTESANKQEKQVKMIVNPVLLRG